MGRVAVERTTLYKKLYGKKGSQWRAADHRHPHQSRGRSPRWRGEWVPLSSSAAWSRAIAPARLTVVVNTGDDENFYGLHVSPDVDTVIYTLAGAVQSATWLGPRG